MTFEILALFLLAFVTTVMKRFVKSAANQKPEKEAPTKEQGKTGSDAASLLKK